MSKQETVNDLGYFLDIEEGVVGREVFVSEKVYQREQEEIFARAWLLVGHESLIPNPGDFFASRMGEESVLLTRDRQDKIHVFLNSCPHRGMKVCRYDEGNSKVLECPYHGWGFSLDGKLAAIPHEKAYADKLERDKWGLTEVAKLANYKGSIWATWDPAAPEFLDYLGEAVTHLDAVLDSRDGRPGGSEVLPGIQKFIVPSNWKFGAENFVGDVYHNHSHKSVDMVGIGPSGKGRRDEEELTTKKNILRCWNIPMGHGGVSSLQLDDYPYTPIYRDYPEIDAWFRHCYEQKQKRLGKKSRLVGSVGTIFPNMSLHATQPRSIFVWHPHGAGHMELWRFYLVDKDTPANVRDVLRQYYMRYSGPAGMTEQDDMENWNYATAASRGVIARRRPYNYQLGLSPGTKLEGMPGTVSERLMSEANQRNMYKTWDRFMQGQSWSEMMR
jgi:phenylpropionate dioxygenase-like ring-hydroxylating dioxygenase large terminal subunit